VSGRLKMRRKKAWEADLPPTPDMWKGDTTTTTTATHPPPEMGGGV